jgi:hypothetical protein
MVGAITILTASVNTTVAGATVEKPSLALTVTTRIMVVGDSISQGLEGDYTWRYRLKQHLGSAVDFVGRNSGTHTMERMYTTSPPPRFDGAYRPGLSFPDSQHLAQWGWSMNAAKEVIGTEVSTYSPDVLLVELGFNDLAWGIGSPEQTLQNLRTLVARARAAKPNIKVFVSSVPQRTPLDQAPQLPATIQSYNAGLPDTLASMSTSQSPVILANLSALWDPSTDTYDGLHPNVLGEFKIAKVFADSLTFQGVGRPFGAIPTSRPADLVPAAPQSMDVTRDGTKLRVQWAHSFGASAYRLYVRSVTKGDSFVPYIYDIPADGWIESAVPAGHEWQFKAVALRGNIQGGVSPVGTGTGAPLPLVPNVRVVSDPDDPYALTVTWDPVADADDYYIYGAPGCGEWVADSSFKLLQWNLGGKTQWRQPYISDDCYNYKVVATRYGGEGARGGYTRGTPYVGNYYHLLARNHFWDYPKGAEDQRATMNVGPGKDRGIVVVRGYIRHMGATTSFWDNVSNIIGDRRVWDTNPYASSKIAIAWDTKTGDVSAYAHRSCAAGEAWSWEWWNFQCISAKPIQFVSNAFYAADSDKSDANYVGVAKLPDGQLVVQVGAMNSWEATAPDGLPFGFGRINASISIIPDGETFTAEMMADKFPAWEVLRYPRTGVLAADEVGLTAIIGTRDQTTVTDLEGGGFTACASVRGELLTNSVATRPMAC